MATKQEFAKWGSQVADVIYPKVMWSETGNEPIGIKNGTFTFTADQEKFINCLIALMGGNK